MKFMRLLLHQLSGKCLGGIPFVRAAERQLHRVNLYRIGSDIGKLPAVYKITIVNPDKGLIRKLAFDLIKLCIDHIILRRSREARNSAWRWHGCS